MENKEETIKNYTYLIQDKIELWIFTDKQMSRQFANVNDKIEIIFETKKKTKRFETTYKDLLTIFESADKKLSQSTQINTYDLK